jgi:hypothetical protein
MERMWKSMGMVVAVVVVAVAVVVASCLGVDL